MESAMTLKDRLLSTNREILDLFAAAKTVAGEENYRFVDWEKACESLQPQFADKVIRVAVVGPIKSGKSTFVNSLLNGDYLKRGAGVVTSIVTRVRNGEQLKATLFFKTWQEINAEMQQALVLIPSLRRQSAENTFNIRIAEQRRLLEQALKNLDSNMLITRDTRNMHSVLLNSYLKGYSRVENIISDETATRSYAGQDFKRHHDFVADETMAVYLKDLQIDIDSNHFDENVEIADCQGSDSSNPLHLAMIQDYLLQTHQLVYVISSRTGLRQADIRFISMIKKIGILDNIVFVINCDFSEHESLDELKVLIHKIQEEIAMMKPDPQICSFSALFNLFRAQDGALTVKDQARLKQWEMDQELTGFSDQETRRFDAIIRSNLFQKRNVLLYRNHVERLLVIASGMANWIGIQRESVSRDADSASEISSRMAEYGERLGQFQAVVESSLKGAQSKIQKKIQADVNQFFDLPSGRIIKKIHGFIKDYRTPALNRDDQADPPNFSHSLFIVFQEFKQSLDRFITENVNPEVLRFIKSQEKTLGKHFNTILKPYHALLEDAYKEYRQLLKRMQVSPQNPERIQLKLTDVQDIIQQIDMKPPTIAATVDYTARIKSEAILKLGIYNLQGTLKRLMKMPAKTKADAVKLALNSSVQRIKLETVKSIYNQLKDYRENLKFSYFYRLTEQISQNLQHAIWDRFQFFLNSVSTDVERISSGRDDQQQVVQRLEEMDAAVRQIKNRLLEMRKEIEQTA